MKLYRCVDALYEGYREASMVQTSQDGGKTWRDYEWYHLVPRLLQELEDQGYQPCPEWSNSHQQQE